MRKAIDITGGAFLSLVMVGCGLKEAPPFDPRDLQRAERARAADTPTLPLKPLPTALEPLQPTTRELNSATNPTAPSTRPIVVRPLGNEPTVRLGLQEIVQRSVANSGEVRVAGFDPAIAETRVIEAQARFDPILFTNLSYEHTDQQTAGQPNTFGGIVDPKIGRILFVQRGDVFSLEPGIKQLLPSGGDISLSEQIQQSYFNPQTTVHNPYWTNQLKLQLTQPLLRDFGYEANQARITIARNDQRVSILDFRKALETNVEEIEKDYWELENAEQDVRIQEELLGRTSDTADILIKRFIAGGQGVSRVQTSQATSSIRTREALLIDARRKLADISDDIKRRMNDPEFPVAGSVVILAENAPVESPITFNFDDVVATAMDNRFELGQQQLRINSAGVAQDVAKVNTLPKLDVKLGAAVQGVSGNESHAAANEFLDSHVSFSLGMQFEIPIGNREATAIFRRAKLQRMQAIEQYRFLVDQVTQDVKTGLRDVNANWQMIASRRQARFASADTLLALEQREAQGEALDPTFVQLKLDSQERLADAEREEALAIANYNVAISHLERVKGTLLRYNNVVMQEESLPGGRRVR